MNRDTKRKHEQQLPGKKSPVELLDILKVTVEEPSQAVKSFHRQEQCRVIDCDILIVGGGTGGIAAALQASASGVSVCLTEETDWLGGQMTSQGVSALDENYLVETSGATLKYQQLRHKIREHYCTKYQLSSSGQTQTALNPGNCWVSRLSFEPTVAEDVLEQLISPTRNNGSLAVFLRTKVFAVQQTSGKICTVHTINLDNGEELEFHPKICLDATELGDLLPLCQAEYRIGAESSLETLEPHAPLAANPDNVQDFTFPFAVEFRPGENHTITKPPLYDQFKQTGIFSFFGYKMFHPTTEEQANGNTRQLLPFWTYRRLLDCTNWLNPPYDHDLAMINWMGNDLRGENIIDQTNIKAAERLSLGKALSLGLLYWLQTEAPRDDGGSGYVELAMQKEVMGSSDGLSKYPYIRESRRIKAVHTIIEQEIGSATNTGARARNFSDTVGIGLYPIDIHGPEEKPGGAQPTKPFQLPLGALIPLRPANLIASAKNIGTTHITNGAYRLHPIEWGIGEAAGVLAATAVKHKINPGKVLKNKPLLRHLQHTLVSLGVPLYWYDDIPVWHPSFAAIQFLSVIGVTPGAANHLQFRPNDPLTRSEAAIAMAIFLQLDLAERQLPQDVNRTDQAAAEIAAALEHKLLLLAPDGRFNLAEPVTWNDLAPFAAHIKLVAPPNLNTPVLRSDFAQWLYESAIATHNLGRL